MEALRTQQDKIRFIHVRHEESAAFMACGYAKYTGRLGVCLATSGPGGIHLLNGLYDAKLDGQPVLAITGLQYHDLIAHAHPAGRRAGQGFHGCRGLQRPRDGPGARRERRCNRPAEPPRLPRGRARHRAGRLAVHGRQAAGSPARATSRDHVSDVFTRAFGLPADAHLPAAAAIFNAGRKICILAGRGALDAGDELEQIAELLGAPIIKALLGKACVPDDSPYTHRAAWGCWGPRPRRMRLQAATRC